MSNDQPALPPNRKTRADDARGTPPGAGTVTTANGGRIGNPPFVATDEQRKKIRDYAKVFPIHSEHLIAALMGFSQQTLRRHFGDDMMLGRAEMLASIGSQMINRALDATNAISKGDLDAQKFILARLGGWSTKVEMTGRDGGPIQHASFDLSGLSEEEKRALLPVLDKIAADAGEASDAPDNADT